MMDKDPVASKETKVRNRRVHLANERTFLAWIRTSFGIMAFGFVVERFSLFVKQISYLLDKERLPEMQTVSPFPGYSVSGILGIILVGAGTILGLLAFVRYRQVGREIEADTYGSSVKLPLALTVLVLLVGTILLIYLIRSI